MLGYSKRANKKFNVEFGLIFLVCELIRTKNITKRLSSNLGIFFKIICKSLSFRPLPLLVILHGSKIYKKLTFLLSTEMCFWNEKC